MHQLLEQWKITWCRRM